MKAKEAILISFLLFIIVLFSFAAKPVDVLLKPTQYGKPSEIIPLKDNKKGLPEARPIPHRMRESGSGPVSSPFSADMVLAYDNGSASTYLTGLDVGYHLGVWFQSPAACTLLQVYYCFYNGGAVTYYVSDPSDYIDFLHDYEEYHSGVNPGPSPIETYLHPETSATAPDGWDTITVTSMPDVAKDVFFAAYIMDDNSSHPIIDASVSPPYHTLMKRYGGGGGPFGWYSSWHHVYIRALVRMYENPPPIIVDYDKLPNSYVTTPREVTATFSDLGIPLDSTGVVEGWAHYSIDGGAYDSLSMYIISGDSAYGVWKATLPGINPGQTMEYYFSCVDMQGLENVSPMNPVSYTIKEKTDDILYVNDDYYGDAYSYDVIADVIPTADRWDIPGEGLPDSSVLLAGYNVIIWNSWEYSGKTFAADTMWIAKYLEGGGNMLVSGMDIPAAEFGYSWGNYTTSPGEFLYEYFGIMGGTDDFANDSISVYYGVAGDTITGVFENWPITVYPYYFAGPGYNYNGRFDENYLNPQYWKPILSDTEGNHSAFRYDHPGFPCKLVWLYFPFAYIEDSTNPGNPQIEKQQELISRIINWFAPAPIFKDITKYNTTASSGPYPVDATVISFNAPLLYVNLIITANGVGDTIPMSPTKADTTMYTANIPAYSQITDIVYYVEAMDSDSNISHSKTYEFWYFLASGIVLYVNESYDPVLDYKDILDSLSITGGYDVYETAVYGIPDSTVLASYSAVVWNGDWGYYTILTKQSSGNVLYDYMLDGGNIFFNSDEILGLWDGWSNVDYYPGEFPYDVLKVDHIYNDIPYDSVYGVSGDTISDGIIADMTFPLTNWNDEVDILPEGIEIFTNASSATIRGVRWYDTNNKVVFLPFMYVSLSKSIQITVMRNVLRWFGIGTGIVEDGGEGVNIPVVFTLSQNKPNPFRGRTSIFYSIPRKTIVTLKIYDSSGRFIGTVINEVQEPGYKSVIWNGRDKNNKKVAQGIYFYRLSAGDFENTKKLLLLR
jgi:hypothetical protein